MRTCENVPHQVCSAPRTPGRPSAHLRQRELTGLNQRGCSCPWSTRASAQFRRHCPSSHAAPCLGPGDPRADAHCPESPMPASHPPSSLPPHLCPQAGPGLAAVDSTLGWLPFSPGHSSVCVSRWTGQTLCWVGAPITLLLGVQSAPLSTPLTLACYLGKAGSGVTEGGEGGRQGRGSFLKERKPGSLGTEKARVLPLLTASCPLLLLQPTPGMGINRDFVLSL